MNLDFNLIIRQLITASPLLAILWGVGHFYLRKREKREDAQQKVLSIYEDEKGKWMKRIEGDLQEIRVSLSIQLPQITKDVEELQRIVFRPRHQNGSKKEIKDS